MPRPSLSSVAQTASTLTSNTRLVTAQTRVSLRLQSTSLLPSAQKSHIETLYKSLGNKIGTPLVNTRSTNLSSVTLRRFARSRVVLVTKPPPYVGVVIDICSWAEACKPNPFSCCSESQEEGSSWC